jgi:mRNA interferase RelE/StbE
VSYAITLAPAAARQLRKLDPQVRRRIQAALELLSDEPRPPAATPIVGGAGEWRVRTGDYRIVYEIHDNELLILVLRIGHRRDVYDAVDSPAPRRRHGTTIDTLGVACARLLAAR